MITCCSLLITVMGGYVRCEIAREPTIVALSNAAALNAYLQISGGNEYVHRRNTPHWLVKKTHI